MAMNPARVKKLSSALEAQLAVTAPEAFELCKTILGSAESSKTPSISDCLQSLADGISPALNEETAIQLALLACVSNALETSTVLEHSAEVEAVKLLSEILKERHGGRTIELRVPPVMAVQLASSEGGPRHTRGTPPNVAETTPRTFLELALGIQNWSHARSAFSVHASGSHVDEIKAMLPITTWEAIAQARTE